MISRIFGLLLGMVIASSSAALAQVQSETDVSRSLIINGMQRTYVMHIPANHADVSDVVLVLHGGGGKSESMRAITGMNRVADEKGFVVVYPQGLGSVWNDGGSDLTDGKIFRDDMAFFRQMIDDISAQVKIDKKKVFACGLSNGGSMTMRLALEGHDLVAAVALVGSGLYEKQEAKFPSPMPIPILFIHGTDDPLHPFKGGLTTGPKFGGPQSGAHHGTVVSFDNAVAFWRKIDGCIEPPTVANLPHITKSDTATTYQEWKGKNGNDVATYVVKGGGHCWPGGLQYFPVRIIGQTTYDFSASRAIWRFFADHGG